MGKKQGRKQIICTIGPSSWDEQVIQELAKAGMDIARVNCSHGTLQENKAVIQRLQHVRTKNKLAFKIMLDTKGPDIRIGMFEEGSILLEPGAGFILTTAECLGNKSRVSVNNSDLPKVIKKGDSVLLDDGLIKLSVEKIEKNNIFCKVIDGGVLSNKKSLYVLNRDLGLPFLSNLDKLDLRMGLDTNIDMIAASFVSKPEDVIEMKNFLGKPVPIISKVENMQGVKNYAGILQVSEGIMVARGDLGVEYPIEHLPALQKQMIREANKANKFIIVATEMMHTMTKYPRPTRAETTDVANAIWDGADAVMLSGETAKGRHPVLTVQFMKKIVEAAVNESFWA